ncbi:hypothetical protein [Candidatus Methanoperedens nitratireducens]|uniref:Uncharacterized protein n=1 Tax=Candidatus Methanoperedens nitratireducens TaxID=1392998 RepID=A0A284VIB4_9EURY|nr:hypothetical protein [Candidatus Methanoperedens nitroreducens]SNQ58981.1 hypothetical protein MNV_1030001 [Candidatus Methanoperedens nitroreducens]
MPSELANRVIGLISPVVGDFIAKAKVMAACKRMNTDIESLDKTKLELFANHIEALCFDLGPVAAKSIKDKVLAL